MTIKTMTVGILGAAALAGCVCNGSKRCCDPVMGNWSAKLPYDFMPAGSFIFERGDDGAPKAQVLYRWGSPMWCADVKIEGNRFSFDHPYGQRYDGLVMGDRLIARIAPYDRKTGRLTGAWQPFEGTRNPCVPCGVKTSDATLGEPIDLLKDGLDGWFPMKGQSGQVRSGWSCKGGILSNRVGGQDDIVKNGRVSGANLMTKRADFYDFNLEYDVRVPKGCNSGVYLRGRFEIQTVDSYGQPVNEHNMAAYYGRVVPSVAAEKPAGEWQHVSVTLYRQHLTVILNGRTIIENAPVVGVTGGAIDANLFAAGPLYLQGDHSDADYRNMILRPAF